MTIDDPATSRLDNFVDAAFAFALTLLVIAGGDGALDYPSLLDAMRRIPVFAAGFALIGLFWFAHVSWRRAGGRNDGVSVILSLALVFTVLVYVYPMRLMVFAFVELMAGRYAFDFSPTGLFTIYGLGFGTMAALVAGLFARGRSRGDIGERYVNVPLIWSVIAASGFASALLAQIPGLGYFAPWTYWLLPVAVPLATRLAARRRARRAGA